MIINVPISRIVDNPWQTRPINTDYVINELAPDIRRNGLMQNPSARLIIVAAEDTNIRLVDESHLWKFISHDHLGDDPAVFCQLAIGHHRRAAYMHLAAEYPNEGWETIPIKIGSFTDQQMARMAWAENFKRKDLTPIEEARAIHRYMTDFQTTQEETGEHFGLNRATISNKLRLLKLPEAVQSMLQNGDMSERQAAALLPAFTLPEPALKAAEEGVSDYDNSRGRHNLGHAMLVKMAVTGESSQVIREKTKQLTEKITRNLHDAPFPFEEQVADGNPKVHAGRCPDCTMRIDGRCADLACYDIKADAWRSLRLSKAAEQLRHRYPGREWPFDDHEVSRYYSENFTYGNEPDGRAVIETGCDKGFLRLQYMPDNKQGVRVENFPDCRIICEHGPSRTCYCLVKQRKANKTESKREIEEREVKARHKAEVLDPAVAALAPVLEKLDSAVWRKIILRKHDIEADTPWEKAVKKIAQGIVKGGNSYYWGEWKDIPKCQAKMIEFLAAYGVRPNYPDQRPPVDLDKAVEALSKRLNRIYVWLDKRMEADAKPATAEQINGNRINLEKIQAELQALNAPIPAEDEDEEDNELLARYEALVEDTAEALEMIGRLAPVPESVASTAE